MIDELAQRSLLFDFYSNLLSERKKQILSLYFEEDLSLGEIALELGISRSAVHDSIKSSISDLTKYESKLNLVARFEVNKQLAKEIEAEINAILDEEVDTSVRKRLVHIKTLVNTI